MSGIAYIKSKLFAIRIVKLYEYLCRNKHEFVMSRQLLKCGTSIGANLAEAEFAITRNDFQSKVYIALKEASETLYWLDLLKNTGYLTPEQYSSVYRDATDIHHILVSSAKTLKASLKDGMLS